jgi:LysM repeat protein
MFSPQRTAGRNASFPKGHGSCGQSTPEEDRFMPIAAFSRSTRTPKHAARSRRTQRISNRCAAAIGMLTLTGVVTTGTAEAATPTAAPTAPTAAPTTYTVHPGDTLTSIADDVQVPGGWQALANLNRLDSPDFIWPGQVLSLPFASLTGSAARPDMPKTTWLKAKIKATAKRVTIKRATAKTYPNNLDGWIRQSLAIMEQKGIPGTYQGIYRNIMRESSGNPYAVNNWDSNAMAGTPSKGLLQVIQPTFITYHVDGTAWDLYDPVANITAACNYAYHRYGSIDNVNGPY